MNNIAQTIDKLNNNYDFSIIEAAGSRWARLKDVWVQYVGRSTPEILAVRGNDDESAIELLLTVAFRESRNGNLTRDGKKLIIDENSLEPKVSA